MTNAQFIVILVFLYFGFNFQMLFSLMMLEENLNQDKDKEPTVIYRSHKLVILFLGIFITIIFACDKEGAYRK